MPFMPAPAERKYKLIPKYSKPPVPYSILPHAVEEFTREISCDFFERAYSTAIPKYFETGPWHPTAACYYQFSFLLNL